MGNFNEGEVWNFAKQLENRIVMELFRGLNE